MAALAVAEAQVAAEGPLAVVTRRARLATRRVEVLGRVRRTDLPRLRRAGGELVAVCTRETLSRTVSRVAESVAKGARVRAGRSVGFLVVTDAARSNLATRVRAARGCVTGVAGVMRREICRNRESGATVHGRVMTTRTTSLRARRAGVVLRVIELHVERLVEARRKTLQRRIGAPRVGMADQAHRYRRRGELSAMTIRAGFMARKTRRRGVVGTFVTRRAGERPVTCAAVEKL